MKFILGKKLEMSQLFDNKGNVMPVTLVQAGPCKVVQIKKEDSKDKYNAIQIGFGKKKSLSKSVKGHLKDLGDYKWLREFRTDDKIKRGDKITVNIFEIGDKIKVIGTSKGKGFQGVVKRHGFHGQHASHGTKDQVRAPGSIGATEPARVFKGMKMPGHMGNERVTVKNLEIAKIDSDKNVLYIKGAVPGRRGSLVQVMADGELEIKKSRNQEIKKEIKDIKEKVDEKPSPEISPEKKVEEKIEDKK